MEFESSFEFLKPALAGAERVGSRCLTGAFGLVIAFHEAPLLIEFYWDAKTVKNHDHYNAKVMIMRLKYW